MNVAGLQIPAPDDQRYANLAHYGSGAEADVYSATYVQTDQRVAIKVLKPITGPAAARTRRTARFVHEASLLREISDLHVVRVYEVLDVFLQGEPTKAFVMEWLPWNFGQLVNRHPAGLLGDNAAAYLRHALLGLAALHAQRVAVRDLRRENLLLSEKGVLKLADLGMARTEESAASLVESSRYVAPEILDGTMRRGRSEDPAPEEYFASDLYSLGFIFYEAAVGVERWGSLPILESVYGKSGIGSGLDANQRWREWHVDRGKRLPPVESVRKDLDPKLAQALNRLVEKDRDQRCSSVAEALGLLGGAEPASGTDRAARREEEVRNASPRNGRLRKLAKSRTAQAAAGVALLAIAAWVGAELFGSKSRGVKAPSPQAPAVEWVSQAVRSEPSGAEVSVDGRHRGQTPVELDSLISGRRYVLALRRDGYEAWQDTLRAEAGHAGVDVKLSAIVKRVAVRVVPEPGTAKVYLDGVLRGQGTVRVEDLEVGKQYEIRVEQAGYRLWTKRVQASESLGELTVVLERIPPTVARETARPSPPEPGATSGPGTFQKPTPPRQDELILTFVGDWPYDEEAASIAEVANGVYIIAGTSKLGQRTVCHVARVRRSGQVEWNLRISDVGRKDQPTPEDLAEAQRDVRVADWATQGVHDNPSGVAIIGERVLVLGSGTRDHKPYDWWLNTDLGGALQWQRRHEGTYPAHGLGTSMNGAFYFLTSIPTNGQESQDARLIELNSSGNQKRAPIILQKDGYASQAIQMTDEGYVILFYYDERPERTIVLRLDSAMREVWRKDLSRVFDGHAWIRKAGPGGFTIGGDGTSGYFCLVRLDLQGRLLWSQDTGVYCPFHTRAALGASDSGASYAAMAEFVSNDTSKVVLLKYGVDGVRQWVVNSQRFQDKAFQNLAIRSLIVDVQSRPVLVGDAFDEKVKRRRVFVATVNGLPALQGNAGEDREEKEPQR